MSNSTNEILTLHEYLLSNIRNLTLLDKSKI